MNIGDKLPNFSLIATDGQTYTNYSFAEHYALCVIFSANSCPISNAYWERIIKLSGQYEEDNMATVIINSNNPSLSPKDSMTEMTAFYNGLVMPSFIYLKDENSEVAEAFDASKNPEVFLFNSKRELVYHGIIDDNWESESQVMMVYLEDAIEYCLDGVDIDYPEMPVEGCDIVK
jgi:peroxiredoxin